MRDKVLDKIHKESQKKVLMNFHIDPFLKSSFDEVCKHDGITMSSALIALIETYIEEANDERYKDIRTILFEVEKLIVGLKSEKDYTFDTANKLMSYKNIVDTFAKQNGHIVPIRNNWDCREVNDLERYQLMISTSLKFCNLKDKE